MNATQEELDLETCSWCPEEVPDAELVDADDGARICRDCANLFPDRVADATFPCYRCPREENGEPVQLKPTGHHKIRRGHPHGFDETEIFELTCGHWTEGF